MSEEKIYTDHAESDIVKMDFPVYSEDFSHIIGESAFEDTEESFYKKKQLIYARNASYLPAVTEKTETEPVYTDAVPQKRFKINKAAAFAAVAVLAAVFMMTLLNFRQTEQVEITEAQTEIVLTEMIVTEVPAVPETEAVTAAETIGEKAEEAVIEPVTEEKMPLEPTENQFYFEDENISAVFEITDVKPAKLYARDMYSKFGTDNEAFVFFGNLTLKNISDESFDFIPQKLFLKSSGGQKFCPVAYYDSNLTVYDSYETVDCGEVYTTELNFAGSFKGGTADIKSAYYSVRNKNGEADAELLSNAGLAEGMMFRGEESIITDEIKEKLLAQINGDARRNETGTPLIAEAGEEDMTAGGISYCWRANVIDGGNTLRVDMRAKNITDYAEVIDISGFSMYPFSYKDADAERIYPYAVSADPSEIYPDNFYDASHSTYCADNAVAAFGEDGYTEFSLFFSWNSSNTEDQYFCYKNDRGGNFSSFLF